MASAREIYEFGTFRLEAAERRLSDHGDSISLSPKVFDTLLLLVREHGRLVPKESFMQAIWPDTFVSDVTLAHNISSLRKLLGHTDGNPVIETVAKKGYRFVAPVTVRVEDAQTPAPSAVAARKSFRTLQLVAGIGIVLIAASALVYYLRARTQGPQISSLVVLPLANLSVDQAQDYLADGLTEALTTDLAKIGSLRVISRTTAMQYRGAGKLLDQIARELGVDAVVEGTLAREGNRVRVTAKLIQAHPEKQLWAEVYERDVTDVLRLESDLTQAVALAIRVKLTQVDRAKLERRPFQPGAYEAYLRARYYESGAAGPAAERVIESYKKAIEIEPAFAAAYAGLARAYVFGVRMRPRLALEASHDAALKARDLDPTGPEALLASAISRLYYERDLAGADEEFRRAVDAGPGDAEAHFYYSQCLVAMGRFDEAIAAARRAQLLDPLSPLIGHYIGRLYYFGRQYDKALEELQKALDLNPNYAFTHIYFATTYERLGDYERALAHRQKYWALLGRPPEKVAELANSGRTGGYERAVRLWAADSADSVKRSGYLTSTELTHVHAQLGEIDTALDWLERALDDHVRDLIYVKVEPGFDSLRDSPRFADLVQRIYP